MRSLLSQTGTFEGFLEILRQKVWLQDDGRLAGVAEDLWRRWNEPHRRWHGRRHLQRLLEGVAGWPEAIRFRLILAIVFHDAVYDPRRNDNELASAALFRGLALKLSQEEINEIITAIEDTATGVPRNSLAEALIAMDRRILSSVDLSELLGWEQDIAKEYQYVSWPDYRLGRCQFLQANGLSSLAGYVEGRRPRIGIYAGSFDPFHNGHLNILTKAEELFDKVIVAVGINPDKRTSGVELRLARVRQAIPFHEVVGFEGLLTSLTQEVSAYADVTLVRGLRDGYDLQQEINQARFMEDLASDIRLVWIPCDRRYQHVSSTAIRSLSKFDPDQALSYLPDRYAYAAQP